MSVIVFRVHCMLIADVHLFDCFLTKFHFRRLLSLEYRQRLLSPESNVRNIHYFQWKIEVLSRLSKKYFGVQKTDLCQSKRLLLE